MLEYTHIVRGHILPIFLEQQIREKHVETVVFNDSLLLGNSSQESYYSDSLRFHFWKKITATSQIKYTLSSFRNEMVKYEKVKHNLENGKTIVIWLSYNPNDTLLLWSLSPVFYPYLHSSQVFLVLYPNIADLQIKKTCSVSTNLGNHMRKQWESYTYNKISIVNNKRICDTSCLLYASERIVISAVLYLQPTICRERVLLAKIDEALLMHTFEDVPVLDSDLVGGLLSSVRTLGIGDIYLFYRLFLLENVFNAIKTIGGTNNHPLLLRTSLGKQFVENGITDIKIQKNYLATFDK